MNVLLIFHMWEGSNHEYINTILDPVSISINTFIKEFRKNGGIVVHYVLRCKHYRLINDNVFKLKEYFGKRASKESVNKLFKSIPLTYDYSKRKQKQNNTSQNKNIQILDHDYVAYDPSHIYRVVKGYDTKNIFYTGACTNVCLLYKDGAAIVHMKNNFNGNIFLIGDLSITFTDREATDEIYNKSHKIILDFYRNNVCDVLNSEQVNKDFLLSIS